MRLKIFPKYESPFQSLFNLLVKLKHSQYYAHENAT